MRNPTHFLGRPAGCRKVHDWLRQARGWPRWLCAGATVLLLLVSSPVCRAQAGEDGAPIESSNYNVDAAQGPISGSTRVIGLAGAFVAIAEGADGVAWSPAASAVRLPYSRARWDYDISLDIAFGGWLPNSDFLNRGESDEDAEVHQRSLVFGSLAGTVYYRHAGVGVAAEARRQALERDSTTAGLAPASLTANYGVLHLSMAYGFLDGQLVIGAGPRVTGLSVNGRGSASDLLAVAGVGAELGAVFKPHDAPVRLGAVAKSAVNPRSSDVGTAAGPDGEALWRPEGVTLPWELRVGIAYQFGPRALNPRFISVESRSERLIEQGGARLRSQEALKDRARERAAESLSKRYESRPRPYLLVSTELAVIGGSSDSVGLGAAVAGVVERSRSAVAVSPRLGLETEVVPHWFKVRGGSYLEPAPTHASRLRVHGTVGFDAKLFHWDVFGLLGGFDGWMLSAALDGARDYVNTAVSVGFWH